MLQEDTALKAMLKAAEIDGSVRVISRETGQSQMDDGTDKGVTQVREREREREKEVDRNVRVISRETGQGHMMS